MFLRVVGGRGRPSAEHMTAAEVRKLQDERLRSIVSVAYHETRFWREWFDSAGLTPDNIRSLDDLGKIPICTKRDLLMRPERDRLSEDPENCTRMSTSGSTGGPLAVYYSKKYADYVMSLSLFRIPRFTGYRLVGRILGIAYALPSTGPDDPSTPSRTPPSRVFGPAGRILRPLMHYMHRTVYVGYGIHDVLPDVIRTRPRHIHGTPTYLRLLCEAVLEQGIDAVKPKAVFLIGEPFDEPSRVYIDKAFGCKTFSGYGANEFGLLALECKERSGMHVQTDVAIIEVLDKDGKPARPGEPGELVITGLLNTAMPLIRYRIGDIGIMASDGRGCRCGCSMPILQSVEGRSIDHIILPGGGTVSPKTVLGLMHTVDEFPRAQLVQEDINTFKLRVFLDSPRVRTATTEFLRLLRAEIGEDARIEVSFESPERLRAKFRPLLSRVALARQEGSIKVVERTG